MLKKYQLIISLAVILIVIAQLVFLYFIKYSNQLITLSEFNFFSIGNIFNFFTSLIIILGIIVNSIKSKNQIPLTRVILFTAILITILAAAYYSTLVQLPFKKIYVLGQNGNKLFVGLLFALYLFISFIFASYMWLGVLGRKNLLLTRSIVNSVLISFGLLLFTFYFVSASDPKIDEYEISKDENNVAIVLGAAVWSKNKPSPILAARVDKALQLLDSNLVSKIQFTGSNAPGELTEAEVAFRYAVSQDADSANLMIEKATTTTNEQIHFIRHKLLTKKNVERVIIVSDRFHLVRIEEMCKFNNIKVYAVPSDLKLSVQTDIYNRIRESVGLLFFWFFAI